MGWSIGYSRRHLRYIGYGVPAVCEHPGCKENIDRGISYICGGIDDDEACQMFFCGKHLFYTEKFDHAVCERCRDGKSPFPLKPDTLQWVRHMLRDPSWSEWREKNPKKVSRMLARTTRYRYKHSL